MILGATILRVTRYSCRILHQFVSTCLLLFWIPQSMPQAIDRNIDRFPSADSSQIQYLDGAIDFIFFIFFSHLSL